jgi:hypothetical protein
MQPQSPYDQNPQPTPQPQSPYQNYPPTGQPLPQQTLQPQQPIGQPSQPSQPADTYDFIINPQQPAGPKVGLPGSQSMAVRIAVVAGGLLVLLIIFAIFKSILSSSGGGDATALFTVVEDQQELIHLATNAAQEQDISTTNQNFAATTQLAVTSSQTQLLAYMSAHKLKYSPKILAAAINSTTDNELTTAEAAATYNQTLQEVMQAELATYATHLKAAYVTDKGPHARALLNSDYQQAQLLSNQLTSPAS